MDMVYSFYSILGSLGDTVGWQGGEIIPKRWKYCPQGKYPNRMKWVLARFMWNQSQGIHWEHVLDVVLSSGMDRSNHWQVVWVKLAPKDGKIDL